MINHQFTISSETFLIRKQKPKYFILSSLLLTGRFCIIDEILMVSILINLNWTINFSIVNDFCSFYFISLLPSSSEIINRISRFAKWTRFYLLLKLWFACSNYTLKRKINVLCTNTILTIDIGTHVDRCVVGDDSIE